MDEDLKGFNDTHIEHGGSPQPIMSPNLALFYLSFSANSHTEWDRYAGTNGIIGHLWEAQQMVRGDCLSKCLWKKYSILMQISARGWKNTKKFPCGSRKFAASLVELITIWQEESVNIHKQIIWKMNS